MTQRNFLLTLARVTVVLTMLLMNISPALAYVWTDQ